MEKTVSVINDLVILEEFCNLHCEYCGGDVPSGFHVLKDGAVVVPDSWREAIRQNPELVQRLGRTPTVKTFFDLARDVLDIFDAQTQYPVLKISGGEILLYDRALDFVEEIHGRYAALQILTNGVLLDRRKIDILAGLDNVVLQISLDGHTPETNYARTKNHRLHQRVVDNIRYVQKKGIGLEINCVLTTHNTAHLGDFIREFQSPNTVIFPRPVRGIRKTQIMPDASDLRGVDVVVEKYDEFCLSMPPFPYLVRLAHLMSEGVREWDCYIPFFVSSLNNYGGISTCTCNSKLSLLRSVYGSNTPECGGNAQYIRSFPYASCADCLTQYELFNLFVDDQIDEGDLEKIPSLKNKEAIRTAADIKKRLKER